MRYDVGLSSGAETHSVTKPRLKLLSNKSFKENLTLQKQAEKV